jgi:hypothetical protein
MEVEPDELRQAVEHLHHCSASLCEAVPLVERFKGEIVWEGIVHVFKVDGHPTASMCYAWSSPIEGSDRRRFHAVLRLPPIKTPHDAVRASIVADHQADRS